VTITGIHYNCLLSGGLARLQTGFPPRWIATAKGEWEIPPDFKADTKNRYPEVPFGKVRTGCLCGQASDDGS